MLAKVLDSYALMAYSAIDFHSTSVRGAPISLFV